MATMYIAQQDVSGILAVVGRASADFFSVDFRRELTQVFH